MAKGAGGTGLAHLATWTPGWNTTRPPVDLPPGSASVCTNVDLTHGTVKRRNGWASFTGGATFTGDVTAMYQAGALTSFQGKVFLVVGNSLYWVPNNGGTPTLITSTMVASPTLPLSCTFAEANGALYIATQDGAGAAYPLSKWDGTTFSTTSSPKCCMVVYWNNGLVIAGDLLNPDTLYWSGLEGQTGVDSWPAANFLELDPGDGGGLTGLGFLHGVLVVLKPSAIYRMSGQQPDNASVGTGTLAVTNLQASSGCISPFTVSSKNDVVVWLNARGLFLYDGVHIKEMTEAIRPYFLSVPGVPHGSWVAYNQYCLIYPDANGNPQVISLFFNPNGISLWSFSGPAAGCQIKSIAPLNVDGYASFLLGFSKGTGGTHGTAALVDIHSTSDGGTPIAWEYRTGMVNLGPAHGIKVTDVAYVRAAPGTDSLQLTTVPDFSSTGGTSQEVLTTSSALLDSTRVLVPAVGRAVQVKLSTGLTGAQTGASPEVSEVTFRYREMMRP